MPDNELGFGQTFNAIPDPVFFYEKGADGSIYQTHINDAANNFAKGKIADHNGADLEALAENEEIAIPLSYAGVDLKKIAMTVRQVLQTGVSVRIEQSIRVKSNGEQKWFMQEFVKVSEKQVLLIAKDFTDQKKLENKLRRQKNELSLFAHIMAHDLKNNLFKIAIYANFLEKNTQETYARKINELAQTVNDMVQHSLTLAEAGHEISKTDEVDLNALVHNVAESTIPEGVIFKQDNLPEVQGDRIKLSQVFQNLFINAVTHGNATKIEVRLEAAKSGFILRIINDGVPISPDSSSKHFSDLVVMNIGRHGLGLKIAKKIIDAHGWRISLECAPKTTIRITIPSNS